MKTWSPTGTGYTYVDIWAVSQDKFLVESSRCTVAVRPAITSFAVKDSSGELVTDVTLTLGTSTASQALYATVVPSNAVSGVQWWIVLTDGTRVASTSVASVTPQGEITGLSSGTVNVRAYTPEGTPLGSLIPVTVYARPTSFTFSNAPTQAVIGQQVGLPGALLQPEGLTNVPNYSYWSQHEWFSPSNTQDNPNAVTFYTTNGQSHFVINEVGNHQIGVRSLHGDLQNPQVQGTFWVTAGLPPPTSISISPGYTSIPRYATRMLPQLFSVTVSPTGPPAADATVIWSSSNPAVVSVVNSSTGEIYAAGVGTATITARSAVNNNIYGQCTVAVTNKDVRMQFLYHSSYKNTFPSNHESKVDTMIGNASESFERMLFLQWGLPRCYLAFFP